MTMLPDDARDSIQRLVELAEKIEAELTILHGCLPYNHPYSKDWGSIQQALGFYHSYAKSPLKKVISNINNMRLCVVLFDAKREFPDRFKVKDYAAIWFDKLVSQLEEQRVIGLAGSKPPTKLSAKEREKVMPTQIFGIPKDFIKTAVDLVEDGKPGSYHGYVNGMPEHQWRRLYYGDWDASKE